MLPWRYKTPFARQTVYPNTNINVKGRAKLFPPDKNIENSVLAQFADYLSPEVRTITVDDDGLLAGVSINPEEDETLCIGYIPFSLCQSLAHHTTIYFSQFQELISLDQVWISHHIMVRGSRSNSALCAYLEDYKCLRRRPTYLANCHRTLI